MEHSLNTERPEVRLRAFRAIDDAETCARFVEGHTNVLTNIGVTKVTSVKNEWVKNPAVFVLVVESLDGERIYGGARVHVCGGSEFLPIELATAAIDPAIHDLVWQYAQYGSGEICGLWNSPELSGYGIGTPLLIRALIAISSQIGLQSLFALCAPYTIKPVANCGMVLEDSIGNKGTFYYPKLDLVATIMILKDVVNLTGAQEEDKQWIQEMRENPNSLKIHELKQRKITVNFEIQISNIANWDLRDAIESAKTQFQEKSSLTSDPNFF